MTPRQPLAELRIGGPEVGDAVLDDAIPDGAGRDGTETAGDVLDEPVLRLGASAAGAGPRPPRTAGGKDR